MASPNSRPHGTASKRSAAPAARGLTPRELEVVEWIAAGKRNGEIGQILACSPRTIQKHVQHILEKLDVETRTAVCVWWYEGRAGGERPGSRARKSPRK
jgi:DNA-binding CsgD family transcriptional regulator